MEWGVFNLSNDVGGAPSKSGVSDMAGKRVTTAAAACTRS